MDDLISRRAAIHAALEDVSGKRTHDFNAGATRAANRIKRLPSAQPEQTELIKEIRKWINSGNRGSADYFIVDKIEEIINKYE